MDFSAEKPLRCSDLCSARASSAFCQAKRSLRVDFQWPGALRLLLLPAEGYAKEMQHSEEENTPRLDRRNSESKKTTITVISCYKYLSI